MEMEIDFFPFLFFSVRVKFVFRFFSLSLSFVRDCKTELGEILLQPWILTPWAPILYIFFRL